MATLETPKYLFIDLKPMCYYKSNILAKAWPRNVYLFFLEKKIITWIESHE